MSAPDDLPTEAVFEACLSGPAAAARRRRFTRALRLAKAVDRGQALAVWSVDLLLWEAAALADGVWCFLEEAGVGAFGRLAGAVASDDPDGVPALTLTAKRYVGLSGWWKAFDLEAAAAVARVPPDFIKTEVFNLRSVYRECARRAAAWTAPQPPSGPIPTSRASAS